jgi:hypothetical protein
MAEQQLPNCTSAEIPDNVKDKPAFMFEGENQLRILRDVRLYVLGKSRCDSVRQQQHSNTTRGVTPARWHLIGSAGLNESQRAHVLVDSLNAPLVSIGSCA